MARFVGPYIVRTQQIDSARIVIKRNGGKVFLDSDSESRYVNFDHSDIDDATFAKVFDSVVSVFDSEDTNILSMEDCDITDVSVERFYLLPWLDHVYLAGTQVSDAAIPHLNKANIFRLDVTRTAITASGLSRLDIPALDRIYVDPHQVSAGVVACLNQLDSRPRVMFSGPKVTDDAIRSLVPILAGLRPDTPVEFRRTEISRAGWRECKEALPHLRLERWDG